MSRAALRDWLERLERRHPRDVELGLERVSRVAGRLALGDFGCPVVTVAGTNGKGSTVAVLDRLLREAGRATGVYTSPHLLRFNERIRIAGVPLDDRALVESFARVERARGEVPLSYFEFTTLAALDIFRQRKLDALLLEVGLGGRLDAVNIVDPDIAVVTAVALDHQAWLGDDRERIALEKAGILRPGVAFVCADLAPCASLCRRARQLACDSHFVSPAEAARYRDWTPLRGENVAAARRVAQLLGVEAGERRLRRCLADLDLPARIQRIDLEWCEALLDVAHNPAATANLAEFQRRHPPAGRSLALFAALSDKDIRAMIGPLLERVHAWLVSDLPDTPRGASGAAIADALRAAGAKRISRCDDPRQAYRLARSMAEPADRLIVFGSFHTVAGVLPAIEEELRGFE